jgi:hypothetical protein
MAEPLFCPDVVNDGYFFFLFSFVIDGGGPSSVIAAVAGSSFPFELGGTELVFRTGELLALPGTAVLAFAVAAGVAAMITVLDGVAAGLTLPFEFAGSLPPHAPTNAAAQNIAIDTRPVDLIIKFHSRPLRLFFFHRFLR